MASADGTLDNVYTIAEMDLDELSGSDGFLAAGSSFNSITLTTPYQEPPYGDYTIILGVVETANPDQLLDSVTYDSTVTLGTPDFPSSQASSSSATSQAVSSVASSQAISSTASSQAMSSVATDSSSSMATSTASSVEAAASSKAASSTANASGGGGSGGGGGGGGGAMGWLGLLAMSALVLMRRRQKTN